MTWGGLEAPSLFPLLPADPHTPLQLSNSALQSPLH